MDSWRAALAEIGLEARTSRRYESEELLQILRELAEELGHTPTIAELQAREDLPSPYTYRDRFERWNQARRRAGLMPPHSIGGQAAQRGRQHPCSQIDRVQKECRCGQTEIAGHSRNHGPRRVTRVEATGRGRSDSAGGGRGGVSALLPGDSRNVVIRCQMS